MVSGTILVTGAIIALASRVSAHACIWTPSMYGFNQTTSSNRPLDPLMNRSFEDWWFHGHIDYPPNDGDVEQLPVGGTHTFEISCDKDSTSYWESGPGGDLRDFNNPDYPCPGKPTTEFHTNGIDDLGGCALGVAYNSDITQIEPEHITIFSVNQTCVWSLHTDFQIPAQMPKCPEGGCICAWFWIHRADSGSEQMYMVGFRCNMAGAVSTTPLPPAQVPRRCGPDPDGSPYDPANCTWGAKQPLYWYQAERNNMFEDTYHPPLYTDKYNFKDGAQNDIFNTSTQPSGVQPSGSTTSPVPSDTHVASYLTVASSSLPAPLPSSSSSLPSYQPAPAPPSPGPPSSYPSDPQPSLPPPPSSSPSSSPSYPSDPQPSLQVPPPPSSSSYPSDPQPSLPLPSSSSPPSPSYPSDPQPSLPPPPSSPPAGCTRPSDTPPTPSTPSSDPDPSPLYQPSQPPSPVPSPTDQNDPEHTSKPKAKCKRRSKSQKPSSEYHRVESDHGPRAHSPAHRRLSSLEDAPARRVWGHRHRGIEKRGT